MAKKTKTIALSVIFIISALICTSCAYPKASSEISTAAPQETVSAIKENPTASVPSDINSTVPSTEEGKSEAFSAEASEEKSLSTPEEIIAYFNECANKVKTDAVKVVKNHEKRSVGELVVPDILQSTAEGIMKTVIKDDTDPIIYETKEEIKNEFLVPGQSYVSRLTADDIVTATCNDNGREYEIYFKLKDEKNPVSGKGVGSVCDVIEAHEVAQKAPSFVKELSTHYKNCEIKATIDKETGRMTHAIYSTPVGLNVIVDLLGTHNITANFTYVKDFSITY